MCTVDLSETKIECSVECKDCDFYFKGKDFRSVSKKHHVETGHEVLEVQQRVLWNSEKNVWEKIDLTKSSGDILLINGM